MAIPKVGVPEFSGRDRIRHLSPGLRDCFGRLHYLLHGAPISLVVQIENLIFDMLAHIGANAPVPQQTEYYPSLSRYIPTTSGATKKKLLLLEIHR